MTSRVPLIAGNWKMNLDHFQAIALIQKLSWTLDDAKHDYEKAEVAVFPPFTDLRTAQTLIESEKFKIGLGAQDVSRHSSGAFTGEVSGAFLSKLNVKYVLIGHSERRQYHSETDEILNAKVSAAWQNGLIPIICVGETLEELELQGQAAVPIAQALAALSGHETLGEFVIAYEPVWAIGTGKVATPAEAEAVAKALRAAITQEFGQESGNSRILYGGSVKANNVAGFLASGEVDGVLVGGASLDADEFAGIARFQKHIVL
ncbi:triose-phosphate isomerase [Candidatus Aquiluna sp. UB-MaderosW2red]|uniref:triose-phosphate isomerase n=1 Tax=Candidatus Aquiluna sp. UB-MaderosW2red TaxID=1855377 RepID=UPI000875D7B1|nr:triose-phosphate isomerase [Candidatus Aquiluna sp. UB-MaderosW2red]SCX11991.1 triosephosphate isomerase (TIM) [Candidatus Aquiluna sp. UB-MaderosW2red]